MSKTEWLAAQEKEEIRNLQVEDIRARMSDRKQTWGRLLDLLKDDLALDQSKRILDIGGGSTSIFLALRQGERYVVDPIIDYLFDLHPFLREVEEYRSVNFVSRPIEEVPFDRPFDIIFIIITLDHIAELKPLLGKVDKLLAPSGTLVVIQQCYASAAIRSIFRFFKVDPAHLHYFTSEDVIDLFSNYRLIKQDNRVFELYQVSPRDEGKVKETPIYRIDRLFAQKIGALKHEEKQRYSLFLIKYFIAYGLAFFITMLTRPEKPLIGLKKHRLFVFQKQ